MRVFSEGKSMEKFKLEIAKALSETIGTTVNPAEIVTPPDRNLGDFAFPCFRLSKSLQKAPPIIAGEIAIAAAKVINAELMTVTTAGPYVNFSLTKKAITHNILNEVLNLKSNYGSGQKNSKLNWVFEFSSPNVAKPFQIYHLRTTIVGASLSRIARHRGYQVTTINHLGDWGTQYGKLAIALKRYASELPSEITLKHLVDIYVRIHKDMESDPSI